MDLADVLRREGVTVAEVDQWRVRRRPGDFTPVGVLVHHTAGLNALNLIIRGRSDLPGPLANIYLDKRGVAHVVSAGRCNHAGAGSSVVIAGLSKGSAPTGDARDRRLADDVGGNAFLYGIEVENLGDGHDPYPVAQVEALVRCCAAICRYYGWTAGHVAHHREFTARKIDMSYRGPLRDFVASRLANQPATPTTRRPPDMVLAYKEGTGAVYLFFAKGNYVPIEAPDDRDALTAKGVPGPIQLSAATWAAWGGP